MVICLIILIIIAAGIIYKYWNSNVIRKAKGILIEWYNIMSFDWQNESPLTFSKQIAVGFVIIVIIISLITWLTANLTS